MAVIGMQPVLLPGVVTEHDVGPHRADQRAHRAGACAASASSSPSTAPKKCTSAAPSVRGRGALLLLAGGDQRGEVGVGVPRALRAVGEHERARRARRRAPTSRGSRRIRTRRRRDARRPPGRVPGAGSVGRSRRGRRLEIDAQVDEIVGDVDVEGEVAVAYDAHRRGRVVGPRRRDGGTTPDRRRTGSRRSVGTDSTGVPSSRWQGTSATTGCAPSRARRARSRAYGRSAWAMTTRVQPDARRWSRPSAAAASSVPGSSSVVELQLAAPIRAPRRRTTRRRPAAARRRAPRARPTAAPSAARVGGSSASARRPCPARTRGSGSTTPARAVGTSRRVGAGRVGEHRCTYATDRGVRTVRGRDRRRVVGHHRRRDHQRARADDAVGPQPRAGRRDRRPARELALPRRHRAAAGAAGDRPSSTRPAPVRRSW